MIHQFFLSTLAKAINTYLGLDPESSQRLAKLKNQTINIELLPFHLTFHCTFDEHGINIHPRDANQFAQVTLCGTPLQFAGVMIAKKSRHHFFADDLSIEGDASTAQAFIALLDHIEIDWEEYLSLAIGDQPAYHISRSFNSFNTWLTHSCTRFSEDLNAYIHEEARWLPAKQALEDFFSDIDTLSMDVERIEAKIQRLRRHVHEGRTK